MRFVRIFSSIAAATLLYPLLPAHAEPYRSLFNQQALDNNPQQYCTDTSGQQVQNNQAADRQNNAHGRSSANSQSEQNSGGFNISAKVAGFGESFGESNSESNASSNSESSNDDTGYLHSYNRGTVKTENIGKDCNAFNQAAAQRDIAHMNYELQRRRDSTALFHSVVGW